MGAARSRKPRRRRVGQVSYYYHHGGWHIYYRDGLRQVRRRVADDEETARQVAAQTNAQLAVSAPTWFSFVPVTVAELRREFLDYHEDVRRSSLGTVRRYRAATQHIADFAGAQPAHEVGVEQFVRYLRKLKVSPNGHASTTRRPLRDKGISFILETCRTLYGYASEHRHLPPYAEIPFKRLLSHGLSIENAKPIYIFSEATELAFFQAADDWSFPIFFTYAKSGLRISELIFGFIEDLDLDMGWWNVRNQPGIGWLIKTRRQRAVPLTPEVVQVLRQVIGERRAGPIFLRQKFDHNQPLANCNATKLAQEYARRIRKINEMMTDELTREQAAKVARSVWRDAGMIRADAIRNAFVRITAAIGLDDATCPKGWRHTFATLLQEANVDVMIRQVTLGHSTAATNASPLAMTAAYTHLRPEVQHREILRAIAIWPRSLEFGRQWSNHKSGSKVSAVES